MSVSKGMHIQGTYNVYSVDLADDVSTGLAKSAQQTLVQMPTMTIFPTG